MLRITPFISIDEKEIKEVFVRASGPGGQNVNKVSTAVQLRFDVLGSPSLPEEVKQRVLSVGGKRVTDEGVLVIDARRFRTQDRNRQDARERLIEIVRTAARRPKPRRATRPTAASRQRRIDQKKQRAKVKQMRKSVE
ncbi:MAG: aminoacyl-tRNA hydrolase [Desulfobacteraceae bacterium]|nr:MAG: aminoacyl-tRNA hydrolase [Desulfobacteraceae bacterium]